ncbi:MAG: beta-glucuronidase [Planctomycetes bacterium]|nr:beta-glucuronidase [Planctomycetota bacterium]
MLYPRQSVSRQLIDLCGIWDFKADGKGAGRAEKWFSRKLAGQIPMPVPASYNDITQDAGLRDHVGEVWYQREFFVPAAWKGLRIVLRVDSATHHATVWVNGKQVAKHKGGYMPFEADLSDKVDYAGPNRVAIAVSNVLDYTCIPPGEVKTEEHPWGTIKWQEYFHDFFNYAGLHRQVRLYCTPKVRIDDVTVTTDIKGPAGLVNYEVAVAGGRRPVAVKLFDAAGRCVAQGQGAAGQLKIPSAKLWSPDEPNLYRMEICTLDRTGRPEDVYSLNIGIRTVQVKGGRFLLNGRPFYFKGCCKHEDSDIRGKGLDHALNVKDFNLLKWMGANSVRTSHYPYSEEFMDLADRFGIAVIDESPAVGMITFNKPASFFTERATSPALLEHHLQVMSELVRRDRNHPCVFMWSVCNEPASDDRAARPYFRKVVERTRGLDPTRPVTGVLCVGWDKEQTADLYDVVCINRYHGWYWHPGNLEMIAPSMTHEFRQWHKRFGKPVFLTEFGADTVHGLHSDPPLQFTEEFQSAFYREYHKAIDDCDFVIGEHAWVFSDFQTKQTVHRVVGNRKGVFTRQRQPKAAAHLLRTRWLNLKKYPKK